MNSEDQINQIDYAEYARLMRLKFSNAEMVNKLGEINHEYFLHKKGHYWGDIQEKKLSKVLENYKPPYNVQDIKKSAKLEDFVIFLIII